MMKDFNTNIENKEEWFTPRHITDSLGKFDLDVCTSFGCQLPTIAIDNFYNSGIVRDWEGRVWCNPPYGRFTFDWLCKLAIHGNGIALIFARTETKGFHSEIWAKAHAIFFFKGRLKFFHENGIEGGTANAPSCLIAYGWDNVLSLRNSGLKGKLILLKGRI